MIIQGFEPKVKKEKKMDIASFVGNDEYRPEFQNVDTDSELSYSSACDGYRVVVVGDIENFHYQTFLKPEHPVLSIAKSACPEVNALKYWNHVTVNVKDLFEATSLFAKNMKYKYQKEIEVGNGKKKKKKMVMQEASRPLIINIDKENHTMRLYYRETEMRADLQVLCDFSNNSTNNTNDYTIGMNAKYLHEAMKLLKNRKIEQIRININPELNPVAPIVMYNEEIYIMILPVRVSEQ